MCHTCRKRSAPPTYTRVKWKPMHKPLCTRQHSTAARNTQNKDVRGVTRVSQIRSECREDIRAQQRQIEGETKRRQRDRHTVRCAKNDNLTEKKEQLERKKITLHAAQHGEEHTHEPRSYHLRTTADSISDVRGDTNVGYLLITAVR